MRVSESPSPLVRVACVAVGLAVLGGAAAAAVELSDDPVRTTASAAGADGIGVGFDGSPVEIDVPDGWVRADPGVAPGDLDGAGRADRALLGDLQRAAASRGAVAFLFHVESRGYAEVLATAVDDPSAAVDAVVEDRRRLFAGTADLEVVEDREIDLGSGTGHLFRFRVGSGAAAVDRVQVIAPFDGGYTVLAGQAKDAAVVDEVVALAPSLRIG